MEQKELQDLENRCIQEQPPACTAACPIHVDAQNFLKQVKSGEFKAALETLRKKQPFPGIIGRICDHPCQTACKRQEAGESINISVLEKFCVQNCSALPVKLTPPPLKEQRAAVVGCGLSGATAAFDLAKKGYPVIIFEAAGRLGGSIWDLPEHVLPRQVITDELAVLKRLGVKIQLNTTVGRDISLEDLRRDFAAVYLAPGVNAAGDFLPQSNLPENLEINPVTFATGFAGVFAGGGIRRAGEKASPINSVADGRRAAISIDRYLQQVSLTASRENEGGFVTRLFTDTAGMAPLAAVPMAEPEQGYTEVEARAEAGRCLQCQCLECVKACRYLRSYGSYPKKYLREIYNNESIVMGTRHSNKMINSCSFCGLCEVVCPNQLNMGEVCRSTRESMVRRGKMPPSAHDFALRDMAFNNSDKFTLTCHQPGYQTGKYLFFPGCQLSGSDPEHVEQVYAYLRNTVTGGAGMMLRCCGAPAAWAGQTGLFSAGLQEIKHGWEQMGKPGFILACSTCYQIFKNNLAEIPIISLWEIFDRHGLPAGVKYAMPGRLAVHDACTTRHENQIHDSVRNILNRLGCETEELKYNREHTQCCGYGGLMSFANPELAAQAVQERVLESDSDYVAYCAMCRDNFAARGKRSLHLLDLIFGQKPEVAAARKSPGFSQRHENRARLKQRLLKEIWGKVIPAEGGHAAIKLIIADEVKQKMEDRLVLEEDIRKVIAYAEASGNKLLHRETGHFLAHHKEITVTYWVEYAVQDEGFVIYNAYSHRMEIGEEVKP